MKKSAYPSIKTWILTILLSLGCLWTAYAEVPTLAPENWRVEDVKGQFKKDILTDEEAAQLLPALRRLSKENIKGIGPDLQRHYLAHHGGEAFSAVALTRLMSLKDVNYAASYIEGLGSDDFKRVQQLAILAGELQLEGVGEAFGEAFDRHQDFNLRFTLLKQGLKLDLEEMAPRAHQLLNVEDLSQTPKRAIKVACLTLKRFPLPSAMEALVGAALYRAPETPFHLPPRPDCVEAMAKLPLEAYPMARRLLSGESQRVQRLLASAKGALAFEHVLGLAMDLLSISGHPDAVELLLNFLESGERLKEPASLGVRRRDYEATQKGSRRRAELWDGLRRDSGRWQAHTFFTYQRIFLTIEQLGVKGREVQARRALLGMLSWKEEGERFGVLPPSPIFEGTLRAMAGRTLIDLKLLDDKVIAEVFAALDSPTLDKWEVPKGKRPGPLLRLMLIGDLLVSFGIASPADGLETLYKPLIQRLEVASQPDGQRPDDAQVMHFGEATWAMQRARDALTGFEVARYCHRPGTGSCFEDLLGRAMEIKGLLDELKRCRGLRPAARGREGCEPALEAVFPKIGAASGDLIEKLSKMAPLLDEGLRCADDKCRDKVIRHLQAHTQLIIYKSIFELGHSGEEAMFFHLTTLYKSFSDTDHYLIHALHRLATPPSEPILSELKRMLSTPWAAGRTKIAQYKILRLSRRLQGAVLHQAP